jgi:cystathionine beta-lyase/cystathionine gamma-synthase
MVSMPDNTAIMGDPGSQSPLVHQVGWLSDLRRARRPGPFTGGEHHAFHRPSTRAVHAGSHDDPRTGAVGTPIYQNSTFLLRAEQYRAIEEGYPRDRFIYSRYGNPTQWAVQEKLAALENAESAIVFSSGMAAITSTVLTLMDKGGHVVASNELYGGTYNLFNQELPSLGMSATLVDPRDPAAIEAAIRPETQILYFEAITNPLLKVIDIPVLAAIAERQQVRLVIDATFATPIACRPLEHGADIVVHSASKYLNGHSDLIAGVAAGSRKLIDQLWPRMLTYGGCLDPHACFLLERGLKTLAIRMKAHQESAHALAQHLGAHPRIRRVFYPLLESHPDHAVARRLLENGTGNVTFVVDGGDAAAIRLLDALTIPKQATSLGGVESLISLPFNTSQAGFTPRQRAAMGIEPGCVRLSVGIEDPEDLIADFDQALARIFP